MEILKDVPMDQVVALSCQAFSLVAAVFYYHLLNTKYTSINTRHLVASLIGVTIMILCYGTDSIHLFLLCAISYYMMVYLPAHQRQWLTFGLCITHVLSVHMHTYLYHYMSFRVDVSHSLMILAMKVSYTAFSLDDCHRDQSELTSKQAQHKLKEVPTFFEYFCFCFCFLGALFGPAYHFSDYMNFIRGEQYKSRWPVAEAVKMLVISVICLLLHFLLTDRFSAQYNLSPVIMEASFLTRHFILWFTMLLARCKYYFSWLSSEAICHFCGLGYGHDSNNEMESSIPTVRILNIECSTSLKMFSDNWNIFTAHWLHFCVYERIKYYKVLCVFLLSATWHGFYPGYYLMFMPLAAAILLSRKLRRTLRPYFLQSPTSRRIYDVITWLATITLIAFNSSAFELKIWSLIYPLQRSLYFWPHIVVILGIAIIPSVQASSDKANKSTQNGSQTHNGHGDEHSLHSG